MSEYTQAELFAEAGGPEPHARITDPGSSELTAASLGRDTSYNWRIFHAIMSLSERDELRHYSDGDSIAVHHDKPVTDDMILDWMERRHGKRFQRNVIARQRGLIREAGWIEPVADGSKIIGWSAGHAVLRLAHIPTAAGREAWYAHATSSHQLRSST